MKSFSAHRLGFLYILTLLFLNILAIGVLAFEYLYGNGDGIWKDIPIIKAAFCGISASTLFFLLLLVFSSGPAFLQLIIRTLLLTLILFYVVDRACLWIVNLKEPEEQADAKPFLRPDYTESFVLSDTFGVKAKTNWSLAWVPDFKGVVYDTIQINTDSLGRRIVPREDYANPEKYAVFFGCSYTYGDGVSDDETLPFYFQNQMPGYQAYNYGFLAYSPLHTLARLQQTDIRDEIIQENGFALYTLIQEHLDRTIPASWWIEFVQGRFPYLEKNTMTTQGTYATRKKLVTDLVLMSRNSGIRKLTKWSVPKKFKRHHYELLADVLAQSKKEYKRIFGNDRFFVVIFPGNPYPEAFLEMLDIRGVGYFNYASLMDLNGNMLPYDYWHPRREVYQFVAQKLSEDISRIIEHP